MPLILIDQNLQRGTTGQVWRQPARRPLLGCVWPVSKTLHEDEPVNVVLSDFNRYYDRAK